MAGTKSNPTLRGKLLRMLLVSLSIVLAVDIVGSWFLVHNAAEDVYDVELNEIARELLLHVARVDGGLTFNLETDAERTLLLDKDDRVFYAIRTLDGDTIAGDLTLPSPPARMLGRETAYYYSIHEGQQVRILMLRGKPLVHPAAEGVLIFVAETMVKRDGLRRDLLIELILPQIVLILIAGSVIWLGVTRGLAPLGQLKEEVENRSHLDLRPIAADNVPGEIEPLIASFNDLMKRVEAVLSFQGRFIADTAHQLRTPVAGLKAHIELALREENREQLKQSLGHLYTSAERLSRLVSQLLSLARNEPHNAMANFETFDLDQLAFRTAQEWVPQAYQKNIDLGFEGNGRPVLMNGEPARIVELINNLVDNAVRYTPSGGRVTVRVTSGDKARLMVCDDGRRIPVEEHHRIFERFHRLLGTHEEGTGLGLAIVHEIATLHNGSISLEDDGDGVGNRFTASFPLLHSPESDAP